MTTANAKYGKMNQKNIKFFGDTLEVSYYAEAVTSLLDVVGTSIKLIEVFSEGVDILDTFNARDIENIKELVSQK